MKPKSEKIAYAVDVMLCAHEPPVLLRWTYHDVCVNHLDDGGVDATTSDVQYK